MDKLRDVLCFTCIHSTSERYNEVFCDYNECWCPNIASYSCPYYDKAPHIKDNFNNIPIRNMVDGIYKTKKQWEKEGYKIKDGASGTKMYPSQKAALISKDNYYIYFNEDEVEKR